MLAGAVGLFVPFAIARELAPDPRGFGTHEQLGLGACQFATITRRLCPTCGMTTSFAWFARGQIGKSWQANPAGLGLAFLALMSIAWLMVSAVVGFPLGFPSVTKPLVGALVIAVVLSLAVWWVRWIVSPSSLIVPEPRSATEVRVMGL